MDTILNNINDEEQLKTNIEQFKKYFMPLQGFKCAAQLFELYNRKIDELIK